MRVYLASRYSRRLELVGYADQLRELGLVVQARWLAGDHQINDTGKPIGENGEALVEEGRCDEAARLRARFAAEDFMDVLDCNICISFTEEPRSNNSRGGRHVEFGIALASVETECLVVGPRENIFHWLPRVRQFDTFGECLEWLKGYLQ